MKNIRNITLALIAVLLVAFFAVSCDDASLNDLIRHGDHTHVLGTKHEAVASTCMAKGSVEWYECEDETCLAHLDADCNELKTVEVGVDPNAHSKGTNHPSTAGDCQTKGTIEYWDCSNGCGSKIDADCKALSSIEGMLGSHAKGTHHEAVAGDCQTNGTVEYWECSVTGCGKNLDADAKELASTVGTLGSHVKGEGLLHHEATTGDCQTNRTVEYWDCSVEGCDKKLGSTGNVLDTIEGAVNPAYHPSTATTTWTYDDDNHEETYDCCNAVKTPEASHSYVDGFCVCGHENPAILVTSITLNKTSMTIAVGDDATISASSVSPADATDKTVNWSSNNSSVASVDSSGKITGIAAGTATITATAADGSGVTATCSVTVKNTVSLPVKCNYGCSPDYHNVQVIDGESWEAAANRNDMLWIDGDGGIRVNCENCWSGTLWEYSGCGSVYKNNTVNVSKDYDY